MSQAIYKGKARRIDDYDLPRIGHMIGVGEDEIHAVMEVESRGYGFDKHGRVIMLFEPHIFYRELSKKKRDIAVKQGLAYAKWKRGKYPKDSYPRLIQAMKIDATAALKSCSWGLGQIMGFNFKLAGYTSVQAMVKSFAADEAKQLQAMIEFIKATGIDDELRRHDWRGFARGYNGASYAKHNYHGRLAAAYRKWSKIKDTLWSPELAFEEDNVAAVDQELNPVVEEVEKAPSDKPFKPKPPTKSIIAILLTALGAAAVALWDKLWG